MSLRRPPGSLTSAKRTLVPPVSQTSAGKGKVKLIIGGHNAERRGGGQAAKSDVSIQRTSAKPCNGSLTGYAEQIENNPPMTLSSWRSESCPQMIECGTRLLFRVGVVRLNLIAGISRGHGQAHLSRIFRRGRHGARRPWRLMALPIRQ